MRMSDVVRVPLGTFRRPGVVGEDGTPVMKVVNGYVVRHEAALILVDTGMGEVDEETENLYRPERRPLSQGLDEVGVSLKDVTLVVNCHLHFDHCGGNRLMPGTPILAQKAELDLAQSPDHTPSYLVDFPGVKYEVLEGETEIVDGVMVVPTPGHTEGHQSLVVRCDDGSVLMAGQQHRDAEAFRADVQATRDDHVNDSNEAPYWMSLLLEFDPRRVVFAHDDTEVVV